MTLPDTVPALVVERLAALLGEKCLGWTDIPPPPEARHGDRYTCTKCGLISAEHAYEADGGGFGHHGGGFGHHDCGERVTVTRRDPSEDYPDVYDIITPRLPDGRGSHLVKRFIGNAEIGWCIFVPMRETKS